MRFTFASIDNLSSLFVLSKAPEAHHLPCRSIVLLALLCAAEEKIKGVSSQSSAPLVWNFASKCPYKLQL